MSLDMCPSCAMAELSLTMGFVVVFYKDSKYECAHSCSSSQNTLSYRREQDVHLRPRSHLRLAVVCVSGSKARPRPPVIPC